jgi:hypothetical protein
MASPFKHGKKERRRQREVARRHTEWADEHAKLGDVPEQFIRASRTFAKVFTGMAQARRKKKP